MKAVVFIHGYLSYTDDFCNLPDQLASYYDKVFLLGLPGSGLMIILKTLLMRMW